MEPLSWLVCPACGRTRPRRRAWLKARTDQLGPPSLRILGVALVLALGIVVIVAWAALVGGGGWIVPAVLVLLLAVLAAVVTLWRR